MAQKKYSAEEARQRKNARQADYAKKTGYAAQANYVKNNQKRIVINLSYSTESDIIKHMEQQENKMGYIKRLIREDMKK